MHRKTIISIKLVMSIVAVVVMWQLAYRSGYEDGSKSLGYWDGWQDAMNTTRNGTVAYHGTK